MPAWSPPVGLGHASCSYVQSMLAGRCWQQKQPSSNIAAPTVTALLNKALLNLNSPIVGLQWNLTSFSAPWSLMKTKVFTP